MNKFALPLFLLVLCPVLTYAQSSNGSDTRVGNECEGLTKACTAAARELRAARELIVGLQAHIDAADDRIKIAYREIETLKSAGQLQTARAAELENVIAAERQAKAVLLKQIEIQKRRIDSLEKRLGRARKFALIAGVAAGVAILIGASK